MADSRGPYHGLVIELKADKGRPTPKQKAWLAALEAQGWKVMVCVGAAAAVQVIEWYAAGAENSPDQFVKTS